MLYAISASGEKINADKSQTGTCPICGDGVIAKCGEIKIWHWAHRSNNVHCESKEETEWHREWKAIVGSKFAEVPIIKNGQKKIADLVIPDGRVIEFQHSPISVEEIQLRESFYNRMIWVFDCIDAYNNERFLPRPRGNYWTFRWKHAKKSISFASCPVYLDLGKNVFRLKKIYTGENCGGYGYLSPKTKLIEFIKTKCQ